MKVRHHATRDDTMSPEMTPCFIRILVKEEELTMEVIRQFYIAVEWELDMFCNLYETLGITQVRYRYLLYLYDHFKLQYPQKNSPAIKSKPLSTVTVLIVVLLPNYDR